MKKRYLIFLLFFNIFILSGCGNNENNSNEINYTANKTSTSVPSENNTAQSLTAENNTDSTNENSINSDNSNKPDEPNDSNKSEDKQPESIITEFSTQIKTKSSNRATNIKITCSKLNGTIVKPGEEFSFCKKIGISKESEGYKKADVIVGKKVIQALGGGNCQVSTTLYNAVLQVPELTVTERHPHGKKVNYVPEGKDAAIAHGSKDLKFKNNSDKNLKIYASSDGAHDYIKLAFA